MLAEVDEQPQVESGGLEIVVNLGSVLICRISSPARPKIWT